MPKNKPANYINHIALVLDASSSMTKHAASLIKVADNQIAYLAKRSQELNQETRITVYVFADDVECVIYDMDVLRLPSIATLYNPYGNTALLSATMLSQDDLALTSEKYGDHAFLTFVLTDGEENASHRIHPVELRTTSADLKARLTNLPNNYTVACLVPDQRGRFEAQRMGFPTENIAVWDTSSARGVEEVGKKIQEATDSYMDMRSTGIRKTDTLFSTGATTLNKATVKAAKLSPIKNESYDLLDVDEDAPIREWVRKQNRNFVTGTCYYQLTKRETIQGYKEVAVREKSTGKVYVGTRSTFNDMLGLKDTDERVSPNFNPLFDVFVQSTSVNRKLVTGTKLLIFK